MSDLTKHIAVVLPGPVRTGRHLRRTGLDVIFPFYHAVSDRILPHAMHLYSVRSTVQFEKDLDYLLENFQPVKMSDFLEGERHENARKASMVLSFDDGLIQCYEQIRPILLRKGIPATFFLNNAFIDNLDMFFRFRVSLLLEMLHKKGAAEKEAAAAVLQCHTKGLGKRLLNVGFSERKLTERIAELWDYNFDDYLSENPVYLSSSHIHEMKEDGFEFGSHGIDHPLFSLLSARESVDHIRNSIEDLQSRFGLDYKYFSFPFTDFGVPDETIEELFSKGVIDAGFGTAGLKEDKWPGYFQRVPMEFKGLDAKRVLRGELNRRRARRMMGNNSTARK